MRQSEKIEGQAVVDRVEEDQTEDPVVEDQAEEEQMGDKAIQEIDEAPIILKDQVGDLEAEEAGGKIHI